LPPLSALAARSLVLTFQRSLAAARWVAIAVAMLLMAPAGVFWYLALIPPGGFGLHPLAPRLLWASIYALLGFLALILALWNKSRAAFLIAIVVVLLSITALHRGLKDIDVQNLSIRASVQEARNHWSDFAPGQASSFKLRRADQYGLNFYLRREVPMWSPDHRQPGWVFGSKILVGDYWTRGMDCIFVTELDRFSQPVVCKDPGAN
jgi:hypothetical protein